MTEKRLLTAEEVSERYRPVTTVKASAKNGGGINEPRATASRIFRWSVALFAKPCEVRSKISSIGEADCASTCFHRSFG
jgi:hypothetical protein